MDLLPKYNRVKSLYEEYYALLKDSNSVKLLPKYESLSKNDYLNQIQTEIEQYDVFFGYDRNFLQARNRFRKNIPAIIPLFADMTMGGMTLWINQNYFKTNDILLFSCKADYAIYKKVCVDCSIRTKIMPLPIGEMFETLQEKKIAVANAFSLLYVGRLTRSKNIHGLLDLCRHLKGHMNFRLVLVGTWDYYIDGREYRIFIEEKVKEYDIAEYLVFKGHLTGNELLNEYRSADVFVNLTLNKDENFGLVQVEAMSQGLPIVCSDWGGLKDHVVHGWNGFKIKTAYAREKIKLELMEAVKYIEMLRDVGVRKSMSQNARHLFLTTYSRSVIKCEIEQVLANTTNSVNEPARIKFSNEAQAFCMQRIFGVMNHNESNADFKYLNIYASNT